ncbi:beta-mannosidase [Hylaeus volcanicus]|uniref:beta-mannosidase n=1 Tax=Hylaeus volcanicus TaxID=313075 RepID=UPI0023B87292|nr:beta-mannosidase [Hylaeus volcanicus]
MSDSMERDKHELLAAKAEETEEMKRELQDMKMYESWYTYEYMKQILGFINESKDMANVTNNEKYSQKNSLQSSNDCNSETMSKKNAAQELEIQEHNDTSSGSIHLYKSNHASPIFDGISTHSCSSPEPAATRAEAKNSTYRMKNLDNEDMLDKLHDNPNTRDSYLNRYISLKLKNTSQDLHSTHNAETKVEVHSEREQKLERWQINPLDAYAMENDVPLQEPERPLVQDRMPFRLCREAQTSKNVEKLMSAINIHLKQTAELWHSSHRTADSKFQWGSPIQVGVAKGSSDKKALTNIKTEENQMECTNKCNTERPNKRKSTVALSSSNTAHSSSDEDEKIFKKKKTQPSQETSRVLRPHKGTCAVTNDKHEHSDDTDNISKDFDNMEIVNSQVEQREECLSPELLSLYTQTITPLNTKKYINNKKQHSVNTPVKHIAEHDTNVEQCPMDMMPNEKCDILTDEELLAELEKDTADAGIKVTPKNIEIKPLPMKGFSRRLRHECMVLEKLQIEKQKKIEIEREELQKKEIEEKKKREEFYRKQIEESHQREKQLEEIEKSRKVKSKKWSSLMRMRLREKECKDNSRGLREQNENKVFEIMEENNLFQDNCTSKGNSTKNINCPICNQSFPSDKIEIHAAECEQYITDSEDENNANLFESKVMSKNINHEVLERGGSLIYSTTNRAHYEEHVNNCQQMQHGESSPGKITTDKPEHEITFPATVPGGIYTDLTRANIIPDNFIGSNDVNHRWIGNQSVTYNNKFYVNNTLLSAPKVMLIFHGLDTFATIYLNAQEIAKTSNMFLRYTFDVTKQLKTGENLLTVAFTSAVKEAANLYNKQALKYIVPPVCVPGTYNGECHVNHIRKMQASFSWDWGPAFPSMGIWKSVELVPVNDLFITDISTDIFKEKNFWNVTLTVFLNTTVQKYDDSIPCYLSSILFVNEEITVSNVSSFVLMGNSKYVRSVSLKVPVELVHKWWPNGYGNQTLYSLTVTVATPNTVKQTKIRVGFRTVELVQNPLEKGLSFYFQINGIPIFAKGSNFIPSSIFPELSAEVDTVKRLLMSVKEANMNMIRVWGGGLYESELFYNMADEYGIMIWQDFMFACGMYPTTDTFLDSVKEEVIQNVQRLKHHASIVLWAGNNENEAALYGNWYGTGTGQIYKNDYVKLYVDLIKKLVEQLDSTRPFVVSSPSNGLYTEEYNYTGEDPYSKLYGDVHYYNYLSNGWDMHQYPRARFSSEYGFQSLPSIYTILPITETEVDLNIDSDFIKHRQHLTLGNTYLKFLISKNLRLPETQNSTRDFINFIYLSQINQAVSVKLQTEFYRQSKSSLNEIGEGMTMGALYWQLNDVWQAPSWSSIDFDGRWKMLHYYAKDFFAPIIVTYYVRGTNLAIYVVSDKLYPVLNTCLEVNLYTWNSMIPVQSHVHCNITVEANAVTKIHDNMLDLWILNSQSLNECKSSTTTKTNCITMLILKDKAGSQIAPTNYIYPTTLLKTIVLPVATISVKMNDKHLPGMYSNYPDIEFVLTTDNIALFVWLECENICGRFSENGFHMFDRKKRVVFHACEAITPKMFRSKLNITTLSDIYN